jgi:hypothetical protein
MQWTPDSSGAPRWRAAVDLGRRPDVPTESEIVREIATVLAVVLAIVVAVELGLTAFGAV